MPEVVFAFVINIFFAFLVAASAKKKGYSFGNFLIAGVLGSALTSAFLLFCLEMIKKRLPPF